MRQKCLREVKWDDRSERNCWITQRLIRLWWRWLECWVRVKGSWERAWRWGDRSLERNPKLCGARRVTGRGTMVKKRGMGGGKRKRKSRWGKCIDRCRDDTVLILPWTLYSPATASSYNKKKKVKRFPSANGGARPGCHLHTPALLLNDIFFF